MIFGPLETPFEYDLRNLANARADMGDAIRAALTPLVERLARLLT